MDQPIEEKSPSQAAAKAPQKVTTTVVCPHCNKEHEVTVEVPEKEETPKMTWV